MKSWDKRSRDVLLISPDSQGSGGIQVVMRTVELAASTYPLSFYVVDHRGGSRMPGRWARAAARAFRFAQTALAIAALRPKILILGHCRYIEVLVLARLLSAIRIASTDQNILLVYGRELETFRARQAMRFDKASRGWRILTISNATRRLATDRGIDATDWEVLPLCLPGGDPKPGPTSRDRCTDRLQVLAVSRLELESRRKNIDLLIAAGRWSGIEMDLRIIGSGDDLARLQRIASSETREPHFTVVMMGHATNSERDAAIAAADILALPSTQEGFGLVVLEAWQHGAVPLVANARSLPELVEDGLNGILVEPDLESIAEGLRRAAYLKSVGGLTGMRERGHRILKTSYTLDNFSSVLFRAPRTDLGAS